MKTQLTRPARETAKPLRALSAPAGGVGQETVGVADFNRLPSACVRTRLRFGKSPIPPAECAENPCSAGNAARCSPIRHSPQPALDTARLPCGPATPTQSPIVDARGPYRTQAPCRERIRPTNIGPSRAPSSVLRPDDLCGARRIDCFFFMHKGSLLIKQNQKIYP